MSGAVWMTMIKRGLSGWPWLKVWLRKLDTDETSKPFQLHIKVTRKCFNCNAGTCTSCKYLVTICLPLIFRKHSSWFLISTGVQDYGEKAGELGWEVKIDRPWFKGRVDQMGCVGYFCSNDLWILQIRCGSWHEITQTYPSENSSHLSNNTFDIINYLREYLWQWFGQDMLHFPLITIPNEVRCCLQS